ncbi:hypothetical protein BDR05DRAFT_766428 [Suillus weaverae]|nr:hypothetical protein BDR05DRAFT_766428 [Suillus weaverae]
MHALFPSLITHCQDLNYLPSSTSYSQVLPSLHPSLSHMARRRHASFESSSSSESDSDSDSSSASSRKISPTSSVEKSAPSTELLKGGKRKRKSSGNDSDDKIKSSKRPRSQKKDNEEPSYPEYTQATGEIHLGGVQQVVITGM